MNDPFKEVIVRNMSNEELLQYIDYSSVQNEIVNRYTADMFHQREEYEEVCDQLAMSEEALEERTEEVKELEEERDAFAQKLEEIRGLTDAP